MAHRQVVDSGHKAQPSDLSGSGRPEFEALFVSYKSSFKTTFRARSVPSN
ncbi:MAG: hypothetical protein OZ914_00150 [Anaerolineaceae bacterium]|nr:hypothetical protein [Anaerolineaceae bacterium]